MNTEQNKRHKNIMFWDDERGLGNSLIVTLVYGKQFSTDIGTKEHVRGFDTVKEALQAVRESVDCDCDVCKNYLDNKKVNK